MYGKLFTSMYDGSIYGKWESMVTFQQMIALADKDGIVDMTTKALAARTGIPLEFIEKGIADLEKPDPVSRTPDEEGRRIIRLDEHRPWGWKITNYTKYRDIRTAEDRREYHRKYWHKRKTQQSSTNSTNTDTDTDTDIDTNKKPRFQKPLLQEVSQYVKGHGYSVSPEGFIDYYESNGWKVGRSPMKDWRAAVRGWNRRESKPKSLSAPDRVKAANAAKRRERIIDIN